MSNLSTKVNPQDVFARFGMDTKKPLWNYDDENVKKCDNCGKNITQSMVEGVKISSCGCKKTVVGY